MDEIQHLKEWSGCSLANCKDAWLYSKGNYDLAVAYLKAKGIAIATPGLTFDERVQRFYKSKKREEE